MFQLFATMRHEKKVCLREYANIIFMVAPQLMSNISGDVTKVWFSEV
jgi:uncharacterized protein YggL (DUF469 family)